MHWCNTLSLRGGGMNMVSAKRRVNLTIDDDLYQDFKTLKELRNESSLSKVILELAKEALEINEDLYFAKIAESRLKEKRHSHDQVFLSFEL